MRRGLRRQPCARAWLAWGVAAALAASVGRAGEPAAGLGADADSSTAADFDANVAPLFARRCLECHNGFEKKGGLDLSTVGTALVGGDSGAAFVPGDPDASLAWARVAGDEMPPKRPLGAAEKEVLQRWILHGAKWGSSPIDVFRTTTDVRAGYDWWSLQPLAQVEPPLATRPGWALNPIDQFVLAGLEASGLAPAAEAERRVLIRRLSFDLHGLPPTPEEVAAFVDDDSPRAYEALVDRLLASPRYGERWARHWLDVARFGESDGFEYDRLRPHAWPYRDWVVAALNEDMPYDEFARLQIAGDVLQPNNRQAIVATGFLVGGAHDGLIPSGDVMRLIMREDELEDLVGVVAQTFLGLTVNCARCHDHKFDPIQQLDYYQLASALAGVKRGDRDLPTPSGLETERLEARLASLRSGLRAMETPSRALTATEQTSAETVAAENTGRADNDGQTDGQAVVDEMQTLRSRLRSQSQRRVFAVTPQTAPVIHRLERGNPLVEREAALPGGVLAIARGDADFGLPADAADAQRRPRLADWITASDNPLFARVMVNRVWRYHMGAGLIETPNDFGFNGGRPSHPELLDWLSGEFIRGGFRLKPLHRLIVLSAAYRQGSQPEKRARGIDAGNRLLWRYAPRRLDAESIRDSILLTAGQLNPAMGGPGFRDFNTFDHKGTQVYESRDLDGMEQNRRSLYRTWARGGRNPLLDVFDCPDPSVASPQRAATTTPLQSLALWNNSFTLRMSDHFAARLRRESGAAVAAQVERAYLLAYGRNPRDAERTRVEPFVVQYGLSALCRVLMNSNEFLHVE